MDLIDPATVALLATVGMLVLLAVGVPVAVALGAAGFVGLALIGGWRMALGQMQTMPYNLTSNYAFAVLPTFLFMGNLAMHGGMARELFVAADRWIGHFRGGLYLATIAGSTAFAAVSGSTLANSTVFTRIALPEMLRLGYAKSIAGACIAASGTLAAMIPPSIGMIVYGIITEQSIGQLMIAGIIPGILTALAYGAVIVLLVTFRPAIAPELQQRAGWRDRFRAVRGTWSIIVLFLVIMGGIYGGYFSPSSAGAVGAFGALLLVALRGRLTLRMLVDSLLSAAATSAMLFVIIIGGLLFSRMLVMSGLVTDIVDFTSALGLSVIPLLLLLSVMYVILGCFIDALSMLLVTLPFVFPIVQQAGIDPIWFGILIIVFIEIGAITPPIGLNLFATVGAAEGLLKIEQLMKGVLPFVLVECVLLAIFIVFPEIVLWLPRQVAG
jgi:tripartite ATP-independent transporter DctM subunit